jgi:hypothetical protein
MPCFFQTGHFNFIPVGNDMDLLQVLLYYLVHFARSTATQYFKKLAVGQKIWQVCQNIS